MYLSDIDFIVSQEQHKDLLREAERERLIRTIGAPSPNQLKLLRKVTNWLGARVVSWQANPRATAPKTLECC